MTRGKDISPGPADDADVPPANTWAIWAPLTDAGEALYNLAAAAVCPDPDPPRAEAPIVQTNTAKARADLSALSPPSTPQGAPPPRPPSPAVPPSMAGIAATHPYSTAFLLGAALSASVLAGAAAAKVALRVPPATTATGNVASAARSAGAARPRDSETLARLDALARELHAQRGGMEALPRLEARLAALEPGERPERMERMERLHAAQREAQATLKEGQKALAAQMGAIRELDARVGELARVVSAIGEREKEPTPMPELSTLRGEVGAAVAHFEALRGELAALSSHFAPSRAEVQKQGEAGERKGSKEEQSINDLVNEGLAGARSALVGDFKPDVGSAAAEQAPVAEAPKVSPEASKISTEPSQATTTAEASAQDTAQPAAERNTSFPEPALEPTSSTDPFLEEDTSAPPPPSQSQSRVHSPTAGGRRVGHLGVNDSGEWRFRLRSRRAKRPHDGGLAVEQMDVILCRAQRAACPGWYERSATYTVGPLTATVLVAGDGDVDMILLDEAWWRACREGDVYTIRERAGAA